VLEYDDSRFPLVVFTNRDEFTGQDAVDFEDHMAGLLARGERFATVFLSIDVKMPEPRVLRRLSRWMGEVAEQRGALEVCAAVYLSSTFIRGALRFVNQLAPPPMPQELFADPDEAIAWVLDRLERDRAAS
jgi:hypothetical protein